jgi:hypothetical protein
MYILILAYEAKISLNNPDYVTIEVVNTLLEGVLRQCLIMNSELIQF